LLLVLVLVLVLELRRLFGFDDWNASAMRQSHRVSGW